MGKRGKRPESNHLKILKGVDEYRINRDEPTPSDGGVEPPVELSEGAQDVWDRLAPDLIGKRVMTAWDVDQFVVFCDAVATYHECKLLMDREYISPGAAGGLIKNPYWQIMRDCQSIMTQIGSRYGLTPGDRAALKVDSDEQTGSGAERLLS